MPPQVNATLTRVQARSTPGEAVDGPPAPGPDKWTSTIDAPNIYLRERRRRRRGTTGQLGDVYIERTLIVEIDNPPVDWRTGDIVTFRYPSTAPATVGTIEDVHRPSITGGGIPRDLQTCRLTLQPA